MSAPSINAETTVAVGNDFRNLICRLLEAAGHRPVAEVRMDFKKVDILCEWRDSLFGKQRLIIEVKKYSKTLHKRECIDFKHEYGTLVDLGSADAAWLVSFGPISPDGRAIIERSSRLSCMTYQEFLSRLMGLDVYISDLISQYEREEIDKYYIPAKSNVGADIQALVSEWIEDADSSGNIAILANYGIGKSTFAKHLAVTLAAKSRAEPSARMPILIPLGEIYDEQSISGLIGKHLAARYRVPGYHFRLFEELNSSGQLVIIFDGLDEMKDGMSAGKFQRQFQRLMELDKGNARIVLLGRPTVFHSKAEYDANLLATNKTPSGEFVPSRHRRPLRVIEMAGFSREESALFVKNYLPIIGHSLGHEKIRERIDLIISSLPHIIDRPVHAQMICELAAHADIDIKKMTINGLYNAFIHFLFEREMEKPSRYAGFNIDVRRQFASKLAWALWVNDGGVGTRLSEIPEKICRSAVHGIPHEYNEDELRRELIAGCLIDKGGDIVYFEHRSLQEYLVAEEICSGADAYAQICQKLNSEIARFIDSKLEDQEWPNSVMDRLTALLIGHDAPASPIYIDMLVSNCSQRINLDPTDKDREPWSPPDQFEGPWQFVIAFLMRNKCSASGVIGINSIEELQVFSSALRSRHVRAAAIYLWSLSLRYAGDPTGGELAASFFREIFSLWTNPLSSDAEELKVIAQCMAIDSYTGTRCIEINLATLCAEISKRWRFGIMGIESNRDIIVVIRYPVDKFIKAIEESVNRDTASKITSFVKNGGHRY